MSRVFLWVLFAGVASGETVVTILDTPLNPRAVSLRVGAETDFAEKFLGPRSDEAREHGSICASLAAGDERARLGGRACNYEPPIYADRINSAGMIGMPLEAIDAAVVNYRLNETWVYSCSWGATGDETKVTPLPAEFEAALREGTSAGGAAGKGAVYVWSTGNGGEDDDCGTDNYNSNEYVLGVTEFVPIRETPWTAGFNFTLSHYAERCSSTFVGLPAVFATIYWGADDSCKKIPRGSSIATAKMTPVVLKALTLNPGLTYRDVQHLAVRAAVLPEFLVEGVNAAGFAFHSRAGFGELCPAEFFRRAASWTPVAPQKTCAVSPEGLPSPCPISRIEWVILTAHVHLAGARGDVTAVVRSGSGTSVTVLHRRPADEDRGPEAAFRIYSNRFWGESSAGAWTVTLSGTLNTTLWTLSLKGV